MRTTLTLESDVAVQIEKLRMSRRVSLKSVINELLRLGLKGLASPAKPGKQWKSLAWDGGKCLLPSLDCTGDVLDFLDSADREKPL